MKKTAYNIYIQSNEHSRTINTWQCARTYYTKIVVHGKNELKEKILELHEKKAHILEVKTDLGTPIYPHHIGL